MVVVNKEQMNAILEKVLAYLGSDTAFIQLHYSHQGLTRFADSVIHQNVEKKDLAIHLQLKKKKKEAELSTNQFHDEGIKDLVQTGREILDLLPEGQVEVPLVAEPQELSWESQDPLLAKEYGISGRAQHIKAGVEGLTSGSTAFGTLSLDEKKILLGSTQGIRRYFALDTAHFSTVVTCNGRSGFYQLETQRGSEMQVQEGFSIAQEKAIQGQNPTTCKPGQYTVILEPLAVSDLITYMAYAGLSARSVQKGQSFLIKKQGQQIFDERITLYDDFQKEGTYGIPFDLEGVPKKRVNLIEGGVAKDLLYDLRSAALDGVSSTGHSIGEPLLGGFPINLFLEPGEKSVEEMISETQQGILITRFHYMNIVNPRQMILTGLTRDGTFLIEDGEIRGGIQDLRFTESLLKAFNQVEAVGKTLHKTPQFLGVNHVPALKIKDFTFTGICEE